MPLFLKTVRGVCKFCQQLALECVAPGVATSECRKGYTQIINKDFARSTDFEHQSTIPTLFIPIIDLMSKTVKLKYNQKPSLSDTKD